MSVSCPKTERNANQGGVSRSGHDVGVQIPEDAQETLGARVDLLSGVTRLCMQISKQRN